MDVTVAPDTEGAYLFVDDAQRDGFASGLSKGPEVHRG